MQLEPVGLDPLQLGLAVVVALIVIDRFTNFAKLVLGGRAARANGSGENGSTRNASSVDEERVNAWIRKSMDGHANLQALEAIRQSMAEQVELLREMVREIRDGRLSTERVEKILADDSRTRRAH